MKFSKLQATGNDFILIDTFTAQREADWGELARAMCDRHFGIGADGLILAQDSTTADLKMRLFNSDGSEAEVSGNGLRCFAKYAIEKGLVAPISSESSRAESRLHRDNRSLTIETLSGVRKVKAYMSGNKVNRVEVNMGLPQFQPEQIPVKVKVDIPITSGPILDYPLMIDGAKLTLVLLSM